ncbi:MAG: hypothetical protein WA951_01070 [Leeuwenhoekiella sp.]
MKKQIKLIWDFRGADAKAIAEHHAIHLKQYAESNKLNLDSIDAKALSPMYSIAYIVVNEAEMIAVRNALKPHRGEYVTADQ